jgi:hypothetical protein
MITMLKVTVITLLVGFGIYNFSEYMPGFRAEPGTISENAKRVKASALFPFSEGYAVIHDGTNEAMINGSGEFFIPFGKYHYDESGFHFGMCGVYERHNYKKYIKDKKGFINLEGELKVPYRYAHAGFYTPTLGFGRKPLPDDNKPLNLIDNNGNELGVDLMNVPHPKWDDGKVIFGPAVSGHGENRRSRFTDYNGVVRIPTSFIKAHEFSERLAAVKSGKDYYNCKWGFIDETGKVVVPFIYDHEPGDFYSGRARVTLSESKTKDGKTITKYGYIDKTGKLIPELTQQAINCGGNDGLNWSWADFNDGYVFCGRNTDCFSYSSVMDVNGVKYDFEKVNVPFRFYNKEIHFTLKLIEKGEYFGISDVSNLQSLPRNGAGIPIIWRYNTDKLIFKQGLFSPKGNLLIPPIFDELGLFDKISGLAYAKYTTDKGQIIEGYVNADGVFQIIKI